jgi:hypothetical protein
MSITPTAAGQASVTAALPVTDDGAGAMGQATFIDGFSGAFGAGFAAIIGSAILTIGFVAASTNVHLIGFHITYKAA